jgi:hypothetical protein
LARIVPMDNSGLYPITAGAILKFDPKDRNHVKNASSVGELKTGIDHAETSLYLA